VGSGPGCRHAERPGAGAGQCGGDLRAWGDQPGIGEEHGWLAAVDDPKQPGSDVALDLGRRTAHWHVEHGVTTRGLAGIT